MSDFCSKLCDTKRRDSNVIRRDGVMRRNATQRNATRHDATRRDASGCDAIQHSKRRAENRFLFISSRPFAAYIANAPETDSKDLTSRGSRKIINRIPISLIII